MKRIINILICLMLVITAFSLTVYAGDENNPEILDLENDITGKLIKNPILFKILQTINMVPFQSFEFIDITSAWFYESEGKPDYLFSIIKIKDLDYTSLRTIYAIRWTFDEKNYGAGCHIHSNDEFRWSAAGQIYGLLDNWAYKIGLIKDISDCIIDYEKNLIILKIPKNIIGDPNPGDVLSYTNAWAGLRFISEIGGDLVEDLTSYGDNYIIQY